MPEIARHRGCTDWIVVDFVERQRTPECAKKLGIQLQLAGSVAFEYRLYPRRSGCRVRRVGEDVRQLVNGENLLGVFLAHTCVYFTMRKRVQNGGKSSMHDVLEGREERFVRDRLHKMSRHIVEWSRQFEKPCIVFEDLKEMRDSIDYGTRMNRRLHHLPFRALQFYTSYKASFEGIPTAWINPEYTTQRCPMCGHTERANRHKKRFKCKDCEHQDHSDRGASVSIAVKGMQKLDWNVPALNSLPQVRKVRQQASGAVDAPTVTHPIARGYQADGQVGVSD